MTNLEALQLLALVGMRGFKSDDHNAFPGTESAEPLIGHHLGTYTDGYMDVVLDGAVLEIYSPIGEELFRGEIEFKGARSK